MYVGVSLKAGRNPGLLILLKPKETLSFSTSDKAAALGFGSFSVSLCSNLTKAALQSLSASEGKAGALLGALAALGSLLHPCTAVGQPFTSLAPGDFVAALQAG